MQCREGCTPSKPSPCRKEKQRQSAEHLPFPPHPELRESREFSTFSCFWAETPSGQGHEDGHGIISPSAAGKKGMAPVACNTNPCLKSLSPLIHKKGPDLGSPYTSCSGGAVLPTHGHCSALQSGAWQQRACLQQASQQCQLCRVLLCAPKGSGLHLNRKPGSARPRVWGNRREAVLQELLLLLVSQSLPAPSPARAVMGGFQSISLLGSSLSGREHPQFFAESFF